MITSETRQLEGITLPLPRVTANPALMDRKGAVLLTMWKFKPAINSNSGKVAWLLNLIDSTLKAFQILQIPDCNHVNM